MAYGNLQPVYEEQAMDFELTKGILAAVPMPLILIGRDERVKAINAAAQALVGPGAEGRHYMTAIRAPQLLDCVEAALTAGRAAEGRHLGLEQGREVMWRVTARPVAAGAWQGVLVSFDDVTALEAAGQMRRDFVANVSHELKTPLTALLGFIETLRGAARDDPAARERFLGIMAREAERMNRLVSDLLSLNRVEGEERVRPTGRVDIVALLASVRAALRPLARERGVEIEIETGGTGADGEIWVPGDTDQLTQVFTNLVENAVKYGGSGKLVTLRLTLEEREPTFRRPAVRVAVIDRGEGFDPVHIPRLTERFYRIDGHRSRAEGGTGLGLAIVKHIVNRHRGRLRIESAPGQGSRFTVTLPLAEAAAGGGGDGVS
jgi:two-component system phosphate regulon sensor histidine kinase PhoR